MLEFIDAVDFYIAIINALKSGIISPQSPLDEIALKSGKDGFAYIDNRRDARGRYNYDLWETTKNQFESEKEFVNGIKSRIKNEKLLYSKSEQFPDFMFKTRKHAGRLICGSLLELKDSKSSTIASFNSTLPTKCKSLEEINVINGGNLVARVASIMDDKLSSDELYQTFERKCFYLVRTHANKEDKMKISVIDGSFFETVPKEHLIYQMFLNILHNHLEKKEIKIPPEALDQLEKTLSCVTDQTIIAASQIIEKASVRPRLRIMAEVYSEGNPHSSFYPEVSERSINFIVGAPASGKELAEEISQKIPEIEKFTIQHKRNGKHVVFQFQF
ncbi:MAG: hypothetical protein AEth_00297 [Candidatus Argoarchaeum ethanivorans]|uniref:Uncharacterized protein n=1 Tax=Candidatus Argoarchaeum ethanivorans TaxID=2608793 RepID=A0A8B3S3V9_9EURY|nr:MAG: hypothetical protein AEth_00297 [Candidatus Argoarchaeum ethanivorans]